MTPDLFAPAAAPEPRPRTDAWSQARAVLRAASAAGKACADRWVMAQRFKRVDGRRVPAWPCGHVGGDHAGYHDVAAIAEALEPGLAS